MIRRCLYVLLLASFALKASAAELSSTDDVHQLVNSSMKAIARGDLKGMFTLLTPYWPLPKTELDILQLKMMQQQSFMDDRFGKTLSFECLRPKTAGEFGLQLICVEKREKHIVRWMFTFYKPSTNWIVNAVGFDDNLNSIFSDPNR